MKVVQEAYLGVKPSAAQAANVAHAKKGV
jgi:hypothetical protein